MLAFPKEEVIAAYYPQGISSHQLLTGGEINTTFLVTCKLGQRTILQRLTHAVDDSQIRDYSVVCQHLRSCSWPMAELLLTDDGAPSYKDAEDRYWMLMEYIDAEPGTNYSGDTHAYIAFAKLLGRLHSDLAQLDYVPRHVDEKFQNSSYYRLRLEELLPQLSDPAAAELAELVLTRAQTLRLPERPQQLIHGDPRIANAMCHQGQPFVFIDWGALMLDNPLLDLGDMLRAMCKEAMNKRPISFFDLKNSIAAYYQHQDSEQLIVEALTAAEIIAINSTMRHLIDSVEDYYFSFDRQRYSSREQFNLLAAVRDWSVALLLGGERKAFTSER